jgi:hypothetical protein
MSSSVFSGGTIFYFSNEKALFPEKQSLIDPEKLPMVFDYIFF